MIHTATIEDTACRLMAKAGIEIPDQLLGGLHLLEASLVRRVPQLPEQVVDGGDLELG